MRAIIVLLCAAIGFAILQQPPQERTSARAQEEISAKIAPPDTRLDDVLALLKVQSNELQAIEECHRQESEEIKQRLASLEQAPEATPLVDKCCDECEAKLKDLESRVAVLELTRATKSIPLVLSPTPIVSSTSISTTKTTSSYKPRWQNYDGKSRMQHAVEDHGIDIRGKSESQVLAEMDAYHDRYGAGHPVKSSIPIRSTALNSSCPGGVCPTGPSSRGQVRSNSGGWYLGKAFGR
jgi:hypothetical protein